MVKQLRVFTYLALAVAACICCTPAWAQTIVPTDTTKAMLEQMSGGASLVLANRLGIAQIAGKSILPGPPGNAQAKKLKDVLIGALPTQYENEPTIAASPTQKKIMVAGSHSSPIGNTNRCVAYRSMDGGATWSPAMVMPQERPESSCSDPVIVYAPDGSRVYYAYMDILSVYDFTNYPASVVLTQDLDIVVSISSDDGATWSGPIVALDGDPSVITYTPCPSPPYPPGYYCGVYTKTGYTYDKPWIGTHVDKGQSNWVYVTATRFNAGIPGDPPSAIAFARSSDQGPTWSSPAILDSGGGINNIVVQGSRPVGGLGGEVLVAWYHSSDDGWLNGKFEIRTKRSPDHGATWDSRLIAAVDTYELPYYLGPGGNYHRWWGGMFPDVEIAPNGNAHLVYTHDPVQGSLTAEEGDIRYISSAGPPYATWTKPVTISDDTTGKAQGYAALKLQHGDANEDAQVLVAWEDHRLSLSDNLYYDTFFARKPSGGGPWFRNFPVSDSSSISDYVFIGDYIDVAANATTKFVIWTDRRDKTSINDFEDDVYGSEVISGGGTP